MESKKLVNIYILKDPNTNLVRYVGKTIKNPNTRLHAHINAAKKGKTHKDNWIKLLLKNNTYPIIEVIDEVYDWEEAEKSYIKLFKAVGADLLNITIGGEGAHGTKHTEEFKKNISNRLKGTKHSKEHTEKLKEAFIRRGGFTPEQIAKGRQKSLLKCLGSKHTKEHCRKISEGNKGKHKQTPEDIERTKNAHYKPILQYDLDGNFIREWKGAMDITRAYGFHNGVIARFCKGTSKCGYGFIWKYKNNYEKNK